MIGDGFIGPMKPLSQNTSKKAGDFGGETKAVKEFKRRKESVVIRVKGTFFLRRLLSSRF